MATVVNVRVATVVIRASDDGREGDSANQGPFDAHRRATAIAFLESYVESAPPGRSGAARWL